MRSIRERKSWVVLLAILVLFAACKGDSPTAPSTGSGGNNGGGSVPPTNATVSLTASNPDPLVDSSVTVTATVSQGGNPVPNGTAVEFVASGGLLDGGASGIVKTTTNGVASVVLTSSSAGKVVVQATVNNVSKSVDVTFREKPVTPPPPDTTPVISSVSPGVGRPAGGEVIRITGKNFKAPVKVLFDTGAAAPIEAFVSNVTDTTIDVVTPGVNLGAGQQLTADLIVITQAGTATEQRATSAAAFTFRNEQLTPVVSAVTPNSGPVTGGTRFSIFGEGFQAPVQVMFGDAGSSTWTEVQVVSVTYGEIIAVTPPASATAPAGSGTVTGPVDLKIININSNKSVAVDNAFRYVEAMVITAISPNQGPYTGGTRVTIDGQGFVPPVAVTIGGEVAQPISVTGTRIVALTSAIDINSCGDFGGPVIVTNIVNGDSATGPAFTYRVPAPLISAINPSVVTEGNNTQITVRNAQPGVTRITLGSRQVFPSGSIFNDDGSAVFTVAVPTNLTFPTQACSVGGVAGTQKLPLVVNVTYTNLETGCTNTLGDGLEIRPADSSCQLPPPAEITQVFPISPGCAIAAPNSASDPDVTTATITFRNDGGQPLTVVPGVPYGADAADFSVTPLGGLIIQPGQSGNFTVTFNPTVAGAKSASVDFSTNDSDEGTVTVCLQGTGT